MPRSPATADDSTTVERSNVNLIRRFLDSQPKANDGFLSYQYGMCAPHSLKRLTASENTDYSVFEEWARELPHLYQTGKYMEYFDSQPVLSLEELDDADLLRANQILGLCAHATVHFAPRPRVPTVADPNSSPGAWVSEKPKKAQCPFKGNAVASQPPKDGSSVNNGKSEARVPPSILVPWKEANERMGRPTATFTYYDYFTLNVVPLEDESKEDAEQRAKLFDPNRTPEQTYKYLRCDVQVFGDKSENIFVLINHDMEYQSKDLIRLCCDAVDNVIAEDDDALAGTLLQMGNVVKRITDAFKHAYPNSNSPHYCDPVSWSKSIGLLIPPILNGEMSMSGLQSSVTHLLDIFLGRYDFVGEMGELALEERPWLPSLHKHFFRLMQSSPSVREFVCKSRTRSLKGAFDRVCRLFGCEEEGFLGAHRIKTMGFLELGMKTGRTESSGQTAKTDGMQGWQARPWRHLNDEFHIGMAQRMKLQSDPVKEGFTQGLVQSIEELSPGSESYRITFNIKNAGLSYQAGDRLEVLPANTTPIVTRMLNALRLDKLDFSGSLSIKVEGQLWREALAKFYRDLSDQDYFPLPSILKIMQLRPLTRSLFDATCAAVGMKGHKDADAAFQQGHLNDVPDLVDLLHRLASDSATCCDDLFNLPSILCSILPPNSPRIYSIANSPLKGTDPNIVTIVISKLWFEAEDLTATQLSHAESFKRQSISQSKSKTTHMGVCTHFLLEHALFEYVPIRVSEEESFHLPSPMKCASMRNPPIFFMALGSGAAPIMAFLEELLDRDPADCPREIYFCWGLRKTTNLIWLPLLSKAVKRLGLRLLVTFSGEPKAIDVDSQGNIEVVDGNQERVTTALFNGEWPKILCDLTEGEGHFFLCGQPALELSFRSAVEEALCSDRGLSPKDSTILYERLTASKRLHADCFYSGSVHNPNAPAITISEVARHNKVDDIWWIFKDHVYNATDYMSLHPGGEKILFDKAGRDCTVDFAVAHGPNNLRVESGMQPYKIGNAITSLSSNSFPDRNAYQHAVEFLHSVSEIRNVYHLDVNMFPMAEDCHACPHSLSMRAQAAGKFVASTLPMLISATNILCDKLEAQIPCSKTVSLERGISSQFSTLKKSLDHLIGTIAADGPYSAHPSIVTEICCIACDFVSAVHQDAVEWLSSIEEQLDPVNTFPSLHGLCRETLSAIKQCTRIMNSKVSEELDQDVFQKFLLPLGGHWQNVSHIGSFEQLRMTRGQVIFRKNDIASLMYVVLSGTVAVVEDGEVADVLPVGSVFGATTAPLKADYTKRQLGNEIMKQTVRVESDKCLVCIITSNQIIKARKTFLENATN